MTTPVRTRLASLADAFDLFLVDQFGVLHDGQRPYDGAVDALHRLRAAGKRVVLLSNSGRRAAPNAERLGSLGFPPACYDRLVTSGEVAWRLLAQGKLHLPRRRDGPWRCLLLSRGGDRSAVDGLGCELVDGGAEADLVLIAGSEGERLTLADYERRLRPAAERRVPALCTNPDKLMLIDGGMSFAAGRVAELYAEMGGPVTWIGKPFPDIYRVAIADIGAVPGDRILCIGDSIEHDIAGARAAGLKSALVRSGILAGHSDAELAELYARCGAMPDFVLPAFSLA